jgi:hypothetical protein
MEKRSLCKVRICAAPRRFFSNQPSERSSGFTHHQRKFVPAAQSDA